MGKVSQKVYTVQKILLIITGIFVLYSVLGFFVLPPVIRSVAEKNIAESLKRQASIRKVSFNPYNLTLTVEGVSIAEPGGRPTGVGGPFISADQLIADVQLASVIKRGIVLKELKVINPRLRVIRNEDLSYNFSDLMAGPKKKEAGPLNFYAGNIVITGGEIDFDDRPKKASHVMDNISLTIPFVSNFKYYSDVFVRPAFSARMDGRPIGIKGETKPFAKTEQTEFNVKLDALELPKYLEYLPKGYNIKITSGTLSLNGKLSYIKPGTNNPPMLSYRGLISVDDFNAKGPDGADAAKFTQFKVEVRDAEVLEGHYKISRITIDKPGINLVREADGKLNLMKIMPEKETPEPKEKEESKKIHLELGEFALSDGRVDFTDRSVVGPFKTSITGASLKLADFDYGGPAPKPAPFKFAAKTEAGETMGAEGDLTPEPLAVNGSFALTGVDFAKYSPYYSSSLAFTAKGTAGASGKFKYSRENILLSDGSASVKNVKLSKPGGTFTAVRSLSIGGLSADLNKKDITVGRMESSGAVITVLRDKSGTFNVTTLTKQEKGKKASPAAQKPGKAWDVVVKNLALNGYRVDLTDKTTAPPVKMSWSGIKLIADNVGTPKGTKANINLSLTVGGSGKLSVKGNIVPEPFSAKAALRLMEAPIAPLTPYLYDKLRVDIASGTVSGKGTVALSYTKEKGFSASYAGDASVGDFNTVEKRDGSRFLAWKSLYFTDIHSGINPWLSKIGQISFTDFYSRIAIFPDGTTNLQGIVVAQKQPSTPAATGAGRPARPAPALPPPAGSQYIPSSPEQRPVTVGALTLQGGTVDFSDSHIKPPYKMSLTEMGGRISGLSSDPKKTADLDLRTKINGIAPAEITGKINPLAKDVYADIRMKLDNMDLPPTSPYSRKYIGYSIVSGQLSLNLQYLVANNKLSAKNNIKLDRFDLSEKPENPEAAKLPVKLAISLLKDRSGLINLDVPVSGDLKNPKFSMGDVIGTALKNIIKKMATAPFALIGKLFGGGAELGSIEFEYGRTTLNSQDMKKLNIISKAMFERPKLKFEITGRIDPAHDPEGMRRVIFLRKLKTQKFKDMKEKERPSDIDEVPIKPDEYEKYLKKAYKAEEFPKPKNALGFEKGLPGPEMEKLMLTHIQVTLDDLRQISIKRAEKVRDYLMTTGKTDPGRLFIARPEQIAAKEEKGRKGSRVDFSLR